MPELGTYTAFVQGKNLGINEASLQQYLASDLTEDANAEFKTGAEDVDFQFRKATASIGNRHGGEAFVGVKEPQAGESGISLPGTVMTEDQLTDRLRQAGPPGRWYSVDLSTLIGQTTAVPVGTSDRRVIAAEIRPGLLPSLVVDSEGKYGDPGGLIWFRRHGRTDRRLTAYEGVEARRSYARGELLLDLFHEFDATVRTIPAFPMVGAPVGQAYFSLPRFQGSRADGSFYSSLDDKDLDFLFASPPDSSGWSGHGLLPRFIGTGARLDQVIEWARIGGGTTWEAGPGNEIRIARDEARRQADQFRDYLRLLGLIPRERGP
jgi:hypothetical protein